MTNTETIPKPTILDRVVEFWNTPAKIEADPTAHGFTYKGAGQILVQTNPVRQKALEEQGRALRDARDEKINGAGAARDQKLKELRAATAAAEAVINQEHDSVHAIAWREFNAAEQALLAEFSAPPKDVPLLGTVAAGSAG